MGRNETHTKWRVLLTQGIGLNQSVNNDSILLPSFSLLTASLSAKPIIEISSHHQLRHFFTPTSAPIMYISRRPSALRYKTNFTATEMVSVGETAAMIHGIRPQFLSKSRPLSAQVT